SSSCVIILTSTIQSVGVHGRCTVFNFFGRFGSGVINRLLGFNYSRCIVHILRWYSTIGELLRRCSRRRLGSPYAISENGIGIVIQRRIIETHIVLVHSLIW